MKTEIYPNWPENILKEFDRLKEHHFKNSQGIPEEIIWNNIILNINFNISPKSEILVFAFLPPKMLVLIENNEIILISDMDRDVQDDNLAMSDLLAVVYRLESNFLKSDEFEIHIRKLEAKYDLMVTREFSIQFVNYITLCAIEEKLFSALKQFRHIIDDVLVFAKIETHKSFLPEHSSIGQIAFEERNRTLIELVELNFLKDFFSETDLDLIKKQFKELLPTPNLFFTNFLLKTESIRKINYTKFCESWLKGIRTSLKRPNSQVNVVRPASYFVYDLLAIYQPEEYKNDEHLKEWLFKYSKKGNIDESDINTHKHNTMRRMIG